MSGRDAIQDFSDEKSKAKPWGFGYPLSVIGETLSRFSSQLMAKLKASVIPPTPDATAWQAVIG